MKKSRSLINICCSVLGQAVSVIATLILTRLIMQYYGSATNGLINSVNQIFAYFILLEAGVGAASLQALYKPVAGGDRDGISSIMSATAAYYNRTGILYLLAVFLFAGAYAFLMGGTDNSGGIPAGVMAGVILFMGLGNVINFVYQGKYKILMQAEGRNYVVANGLTLLQIAACILKAAGILAGLPIVPVMGLGFAASLIQTLYYYRYVRKHYRWLDLKTTPAALHQTGSVMIHQVSQLVFQNTDVVILTIACDLRVVSVYVAYKTVTTAVSALTSQLSDSVLFKLGQEFASDPEGYRRDIDRFDAAFTMVSFALFAVTYILYLPFIRLYTRGITDIGYVDAGLPLLFVAIELLSGCRKAMNNTIQVAAHFKATVSRTVTETVINLAVSIALVSSMGMKGALLGTVAALLYRSNDIILYGNRRILSRSAWMSYRFYLVNILAFLPAVYAADRLHIELTNYGSFILYGLILTPILLLWYYGVNRLFFREQIRAIGTFLGDNRS